MVVTLIEDYLLESVKSDFIDYLHHFEVNNAEELVDKFELLKKNDRIREVEKRDYNYWRQQGYESFVKFILNFEKSKTHVQRLAKSSPWRWCF